MLEVDGGEGGGQIVRTALALSAVVERPVEVTDIRGNRPEPGLKPQHLTVVETLADICDATVEGATRGAESLTFEPGEPQGGHYEVDIGTAGSVTLLFDAVLPLATTLSAPLSVTATGGTAVKWSPPLAAHQHVKLPLCRRVGLQAALERERTGFYPAGGGRSTLHLAPSSLAPLSLTDRGDLRGARIYSRESADLAANAVADRQADAARSRLDAAGIEVVESVTTTAASDSPGSSLVVLLEFERTRAGFDALGEAGKPAEDVATEAVEEALAFEAGQAVVDSHLADQLLVLLALAGGEIVIPERTAHVETSLDLLATFGFDVTVDAGEPVTVTAAPPSSAGRE